MENISQINPDDMKSSSFVLNQNQKVFSLFYCEDGSPGLKQDKLFKELCLMDQLDQHDVYSDQ